MSQLEQVAKRQAVKVAANLRQAASMLSMNDTMQLIEGNDHGRTYIEKLAAAILATLTPIEAKPAKTLSLKRDVA